MATGLRDRRKRDPMSLGDEIGALRRHIESRFERAELEHSPFPHVVVAGFFPADVYADILRFNPFRANAGAQWLPPEESGNVSARTPYFARKQIDLRAAHRFEAPQAASDSGPVSATRCSPAIGSSGWWSRSTQPIFACGSAISSTTTTSSR